MRKRRSAAGIFAATFILVFVCLSAVFAVLEYEQVQQEKSEYRYVAMNESNIIRDYFDTVTARAYTVQALLVSDDGDTAGFSEIAERCYAEVEEQCGMKLKNIAIAPEGVVEQVYPLEGNESLIGFNFMDTTQAGNEEAIEAYRKEEMVVTQPFELVQGGIGMGARLPVFLDTKDGRELWGLVTVTLDFEKFIESADLSQLYQRGIDYRLWYENEDGEVVTLDGQDDLPENAVEYEFTLNNLKWYISVVPHGGWYSLSEILLGAVVILLVSLLCAQSMGDKRQIKESKEKLEAIVYMDALTRSYSRQYINSILIDASTGLWKDRNMKPSLALIDIDFFKQLNDTFGHAFGDRVLVSVVEVFQRNVKEENGDRVIRYGGDEFIIIYNDVTRQRLEKKMNSIVEQIRELKFHDCPEAKVSISAGGCLYDEKEPKDYYTMVKLADEQLYHAKENGRGRFWLEQEKIE